MNQNLYLNTIGLIIRAHKYTFGETMLFDIRANKVFYVIIATDMGASSKKKIIDKCNFYNIPYIELLNKEEFKRLFHKDISSFGVNDKNLAEKLKMNLEKGGE